MIASMKLCAIASTVASVALAAPPSYNQSAVPVSAPADVPGDASKIVDGTFHSWACAVHWWPDYAGNDSAPNILSRTLVDIISEKTGAIPYFRVGGTSGDRTYYIPDQEKSITTEFGVNGIPSNVSIGPVFFEGFNNFPSARYHFQVNLNRNDSGALDDAVVEARKAVDTIGTSLESLEIGNEPDFYPMQETRPPDYDVADYVDEWLTYADAISEQVLDGNNAQPFFQALTYAGPFTGFSVEGAFDAGINEKNYVKSVSIHQYMTGHPPTVNLQNSFMNHGAIVGNLSGFEPVLDYLDANQPDIPLYLAEVNSDLATLNMDEYEGVFGSALWLCDYMLYAMSISIARVYIQQGTIFGFASWRPIAVDGSEPQVRPPYYGDLFIADAIGTGTDLQAVNIDLANDQLTAYGLYYSGQLAKYAVINLLEYNTTATYPRPFETIELSVPGDVATARLRVLTAPGANADGDITWAGQSWNYSSSAEGQVDITGQPTAITLTPNNGSVRFDLSATEAVIVELERGGGAS